MDSHWSGRTCLVTGAAGFGGSHLCSLLLSHGASVIGLDRWYPLSSYLAHTGDLSKIDRVEGDIRDEGLLRQLLERFDVDTVFHLAAQPIVPVSNQIPMETFSINATGTMAVLEAIRATGNKRGLVFASSGAYYGATSTNQAIGETHPPLPALNTYAPSKVAADEMVRTYARVFGTRAAVCRFMNTFGEGDTNFTRIVPRAAQNLVKGVEYDFGDRDDGSSCLDFLHVSDMSRAYLALGEKLDQPGVHGEAFNIGSGKPTTTREITRLASLAYDGKVREPVFRGPIRITPVIKSLDISKAGRLLGWQPQLSMTDALQRTMSWYRDSWNGR
ncbi:MAG: hypothetical protein RL173_3263 [Fibrobacterota bacterium]|jgi:CDP-glucose 4,6-dehydratase